MSKSPDARTVLHPNSFFIHNIIKIQVIHYGILDSKLVCFSLARGILHIHTTCSRMHIKEKRSNLFVVTLSSDIGCRDW